MVHFWFFFCNASHETRPVPKVALPYFLESEPGRGGNSTLVVTRYSESLFASAQTAPSLLMTTRACLAVLVAIIEDTLRTLAGGRTPIGAIAR